MTIPAKKQLSFGRSMAQLSMAEPSGGRTSDPLEHLTERHHPHLRKHQVVAGKT